MVRHANNAADTPVSELPEILRGSHLAAILTPLILQATARLAADFEAQHLGRAMGPAMDAIRSMVAEIRAYHGLPWIDPRTLEPLDSGTDAEAAAVAFLDGAQPEPAGAES